MQLKKYLLLGFFILVITGKGFAQNAPSAETVLKEATEKAAKENKQVFLIFHASWCGWCHRMDSLLTKSSLSKTFDKHFVLTHITILEHNAARKKDENPGGMDVFAQYGGGDDTGIPYWVVLGKDGKQLANSRLKGADEDLTGVNGDNSGCPGTPEEIDYFKTVLKKASNYSQKDADEVGNVFGKK